MNFYQKDEYSIKELTLINAINVAPGQAKTLDFCCDFCYYGDDKSYKFLCQAAINSKYEE
jgi:hypothetical protein